ncbi:hypothetical protein SDC9_184985 [bioreactor metagenome]|uniref:Uncharacterized protein n=1 Tax=bioreactor metagenome TaxID=1076179 RepID=A0A645HFX1_9ZZZZ
MRLLRGGHDLGEDFRVLLAHVFDLHGEQRAVGEGLLQHLAGVVGVDMNLDDFVVIHQYQAVPQSVQEAPQKLGVLFGVPRADKLGAVAEGDLLGGERGEIRLFLKGGGSVSQKLGHGQAPQLVEHALENH